jgi:hypothetical protein
VEEVMKVEVAKGVFAEIDDEDADKVGKCKWSLSGNGYVVGYVKGSWNTETQNGERPYLHRYIVDAPPNSVVDHLNNDPLDNRKENLRVTKHGHNIARNNRNGGVHQRESGRWTCVLMIDRKTHSLGMFDTEQEAIEARKEFLKQHAPERL